MAPASNRCTVRVKHRMTRADIYTEVHAVAGSVLGKMRVAHVVDWDINTLTAGASCETARFQV